MLKINNFEVRVNLGCSTEEQADLQPVLFSIVITFNHEIQAERTDRLEDSINYVGLVEVIKKIAQQKPYNMIEHLCFNVTHALKNYIDGKFSGHLNVEVTKIEVPIENLRGGTSWSCQTNL